MLAARGERAGALDPSARGGGENAVALADPGLDRHPLHVADGDDRIELDLAGGEDAVLHGAPHDHALADHSGAGAGQALAADPERRVVGF